jgi:hypothetical protein
MMDSGGEYFSETEVLNGISADIEDFVAKIDDNTGTQFDEILTWELSSNTFSYLYDNLYLELDGNGKVTFNSYHEYKDETSGWRTVFWKLSIYLQDGYWSSWDPNGNDRTLIASTLESWYYSAPTGGWVTLSPYISHEYDPDDGENFIYMQIHAETYVSDSNENANILFWNIPVDCT